MTALKLSELGIELDEEKLLDRAAQIIADRALGKQGIYEPDPDNEYTVGDPFIHELDKRVKKKIDEAVEKIAGKNVLPHIDKFIEDYCLQETNQWGEAKGEKVTFTEYLVQRTNEWIGEKVNHNGEPKPARDSYGWRAHSTRLAHHIDKHLGFHMERAMKAVIGSAMPTLEKGLNEALAVNIKTALEDIRVSVSAKK